MNLFLGMIMPAGWSFNARLKTYRMQFAVVAFAHANLAMGAGGPMFPLPKGAIEPAHVVLQAGIGEQDYFWFQEKYPGVAVMKHYASHFSTWRLCRGWDEAWSTYADTSRADHTFVHQLVRHWTSPSNDTEVTVAIKYDSPGIARRDLPASDRQYVAVIRHKVPDAQKFLAELGVKCNKSHTAK